MSVTTVQPAQPLAEDHVGLVYHIARQIHHSRKKHGHSIPIDEMLGDGTLGLLRACEGYDASTGYSFSTYAAPKIRGAILDGLRKEAGGRTESARNRVPSSIDALHPMSQHLTCTRPNALDTVVAWDMSQRLSDALDACTEQQRDVLRLFFVEGYASEQIADIFGMSVSWINQIRKQALDALRSRLGHA